MTYEDVARELFKDKNRYITTFSCLKGQKDVTCTSSKQAEKTYRRQQADERGEVS